MKLTRKGLCASEVAVLLDQKSQARHLKGVFIYFRVAGHPADGAGLEHPRWVAEMGDLWLGSESTKRLEVEECVINALTPSPWRQGRSSGECEPWKVSPKRS